MSSFVLDRPSIHNDFNGNADLPPAREKQNAPKIYYAVTAIRTSCTSDKFAQRMFREVFLRCSEGKTQQERDRIAAQARNMSLEMHRKGRVICGIYSRDVAESVLCDTRSAIAARTGKCDGELRLGLIKI